MTFFRLFPTCGNIRPVTLLSWRKDTSYIWTSSSGLRWHWQVKCTSGIILQGQRGCTKERFTELAQVSNIVFAVRGFYLFRSGRNLFWRWISFHQVRVNPLQKDTWGPLSLSLPWDGYGGGTALMIKYGLHIKMYYFQPQKYLPKNQGSRPPGQKENSHSPESWRRPGHTAGAGHDGVLYHDVLPAGNHAPALLHAKVIPWLSLVSHPLLQLTSCGLFFFGSFY